MKIPKVGTKLTMTLADTPLWQRHIATEDMVKYEGEYKIKKGQEYYTLKAGEHSSIYALSEFDILARPDKQFIVYDEEMK
jgi:hypothetical protein